MLISKARTPARVNPGRRNHLPKGRHRSMPAILPFSRTGECWDFRRFRAAYEKHCAEQNVEPLPVMIAPDTLYGEGVAGPTSRYLGFIALMIEAAEIPDALDF
ncbi:hypothetical protein [Agromyces larvae]|uniref:Uncharacterized protein n=1 Tax=Agromyces larvae TaxID=2929802 RepID=A0ABY4BW09_9MICO|nr:hypothetical protein [Agromyces larvae]UOE43089.1 hypothetical protein MTO99_12930 [Agromyces larvae]